LRRRGWEPGEKGFAVVAEEIGKHFGRRKILTSNVDELLGKMNTASRKSAVSVTETVNSIGKVNRDIEIVSDMMAKNSEAIGHMTSRIAAVAMTSEKINTSLQESYAAFESVNADMQNLSRSSGGTWKKSASPSMRSLRPSAVLKITSTLWQFPPGIW
jgi:methyl-accepting chemotaxis protein